MSTQDRRNRYRYELANVYVNGDIVAVRLTIMFDEFKTTRQFLVNRDMDVDDARKAAKHYFNDVKERKLSIKKMDGDDVVMVADQVIERERQRRAKWKQRRENAEQDVRHVLANYAGVTTIFAYRNVFGEWVA